MSKAPAFQLYAADFYMDTNTWTIYEIGIYTRLLLSQWVNGPLPNDENRLARASGCSVKAFRSGWGQVKSKFSITEDHKLYNQRLEEVRNEQNEYKEKQSVKGKKSAKIRWGDKVTTVITTVMPMLQPEDQPKCNPSPSPSSSSLTATPIEDSKESLSESGKNDSDENGGCPLCPQQEIIKIYHRVLPELPRVKQWPDGLQAILRTRWKENPVRQTLEWWESYFMYIHNSDFLMGRTKEAFIADLEWVIRPKNFTKIANGRYHRGGTSGIASWLEGRQGNETAG